MDVAKRLADWRDRRPDQWFTAINRYLPPGITAVLIIAIAYQLASLTWILLPGSTPSIGAPAAPQASNAGPAVDLTILLNSRLFGEGADRPAPAPTEVVDAPDT